MSEKGKTHQGGPQQSQGAQRDGRAWAKPRIEKQQVDGPGHVQMDSFEFPKSRKDLFIFLARDVYSNFGLSMCLPEVSDGAATLFLDFVRKRLPFPIADLQVDRGDEFKGLFEQACQMLEIPLHVVGPGYPGGNAEIKNLNGTLRREVFNWRDDYEFSVPGIQEVLDHWMHQYNHVRPNMALSYRDDRNRRRYRTPMEAVEIFYLPSQAPAPDPTSE